MKCHQIVRTANVIQNSNNHIDFFKNCNNIWSNTKNAMIIYFINNVNKYLLHFFRCSGRVLSALAAWRGCSFIRGDAARLLHIKLQKLVTMKRTAVFIFISVCAVSGKIESKTFISLYYSTLVKDLFGTEAVLRLYMNDCCWMPVYECFIKPNCILLSCFM